MDKGYVEVAETFVSIQGESTYAGMPCFFVRLSGCNLRCRYCDTPQAYGRGVKTPVSHLVHAMLESKTALAEITGGEPLLQQGFPALARGMRDAGDRTTILVETNGSQDISNIPAGVVAIMDVKCPSSGMAGANDMKNLERLRSVDQVKFVMADRADYEWARDLVRKGGFDRRCAAVHFGAVHGELDVAALAHWVLDDGLPVRLHMQLHKQIGLM
jgi:7-carboxy-7-deazaguanine synthase